MKVLAVVFCLFVSMHVLAQDANKPPVPVQNPDDSARNAGKNTSIVIVDGEIYKGDIKSIDPKVIVNVAVVKDASTADPSKNKLADEQIIIITRPYAIKAYQKKFSTFNARYKKYLDTHKGDDTNLAYVLNNTIVNTDRKGIIQDFYQLAPADIKSIDFKKDSHFTTDATIIITTKDNN